MPDDPATDQRQLVVTAAVEVLADYGTHGLTARRVAQAAGASTMTIYTHFGGMAELRQAVRARGFEQIAAAMTAEPPDDDPLVELVRMALRYIDFAIAHPALYRAAWAEAPAAAGDLEAVAQPLQPIKDLLRRWMTEDAVDADPDEMALHLWSVINGVLTFALSGFLTVDQARNQVFTLAERVLRGYGAFDGTRWRAAIHDVTRAADSPATTEALRPG